MVIGHLYTALLWDEPLLEISDMVQFNLPPTENDMCLYSPAAEHHHPLAGTHYILRLPTEGWPGCVDLGGWLYSDIDSPTPGVEPQTLSSIPVLTKPGVE